MGKLNFLIGLPRSGKSTFSKKWKEENPNGVVLSGDSFRLSIYNRRYQKEGEELVRATLITAARALLIDGYDVLIDETNTSVASVRQILSIQVDAKAYFFNVSAKTCKQRAIDCCQEDLIASIDRMNDNLEYTLDYLNNIKFEIQEVSPWDIKRMGKNA